jgi:DNA-binding CsgD family transcriptional regulator
VPDTIEDAILARAARLSPEAREVARAGAVIGRCFVPEVLAGVLDRPLGDLDAPLQELVASSFLYPFELLDRGYYDFRHQLLRDALYGSVPAFELRRLHARAGEFGAELSGATDVHASVHFERAGLRAQAFRAALAGARAAAALSSRRESFELYARAVANIPDDIPALERADLYTGYFEAASAVDDVAVMTESARLARRWYLEAGRPAEAAAALLSEAGVARRDVRPASDRLRLLEQVESELGELPESAERSAELSDLRQLQAIVRLDRGQLDEAAALLDEARSLWLASGGTDTRDIDYLAATIDVLEGRVDAGLEVMFRIAREARDLRLEGTGVTAFRWAAAIAVRVMHYRAAELGLGEGLRYADEIEQSYCRHVLAATSAHVAWAQGRWDDATRAAEIEIVERGSRRGTLGSRDALGYVAFGRGQVERAREQFEASLAVGTESCEVDLVLPATWGLAETALVAGEAGVAIEHCESGYRLAAATGERALLIPFVVTGVRAFQAARRPDAAERWLDQARAFLAGWDALARPALEHATGLVRLAAGATIAARAALEAAIEGWDARPRTWEASCARLDLATCLVRANRQAEALPILRDVRALAERLDSAPLRERADELARLARSRGAEDEPWRPLTAREFEIARLVAEGLTNVAIADALGLSPRTVGAHVEHILAKLDASRRSEIAVWVVGIRPAGPAAEGAVTKAQPAAVAHG